MISATHSHTGPLMIAGGMREMAYGGKPEVPQQHMRDLPKKIAETITSANADLQPERVFREGP